MVTFFIVNKDPQFYHWDRVEFAIYKIHKQTKLIRVDYKKIKKQKKWTVCVFLMKDVESTNVPELYFWIQGDEE